MGCSPGECLKAGLVTGVAYFWQVGHQWVPRPARVMRRMGVAQTRQGRAVRR